MSQLRFERLTSFNSWKVLRLNNKISKTFDILRKAYDGVVRVKTISCKMKKCSHLFCVMVKNRKILIFVVRFKTVVRLTIVVA